MTELLRAPDFENLAAVLEKRAPARPTMFEYYLNERLYERFTGLPAPDTKDDYVISARLARAYAALGYDYVTLSCPWGFPGSDAHTIKTKSLNKDSLIPDSAAFDKYPWPDAGAYDYSYIERLAGELPRGQGIIVAADEGVLETVTALTGYDNLCYLLYDDEDLAESIFAKVGEIILDYYKRVIKFKGVRAILLNDDWGFQAQTLISPPHLRKLVFPWYKEAVRLAHEAGLYTILHSCGVYRPILNDLIDMGLDARHSYEDKVVPVEEAYLELQGKIAVLGGIDVDFLCRKTPEEIERRARDLANLTGYKGFAMGSGNSIPDYMPDENYLAMRRVVLEG